MTSTTVTPGVGDYVVMLSAKFDGATNGDDHVIVSIYVNGVQVAGSERQGEVRKNRFGSHSTQAHVTGVLDGQAIDGRWRTTSGRTLTLQQRSLIVIKIQ